MKLAKYKFYYIAIFITFSIGFIIPENKAIPVKSASIKDWNQKSFWFEPWGESGVHKGIDIFAEKGQSVIASTNLIILYTGDIQFGGKVVLGLGAKWRLHYFAHLGSFNVEFGEILKAGRQIGTVGDSGNAKGKAAHLHFSIFSLIPVLWKIDSSTQGYKKAFYINPNEYLADL